ncbi:MAG: SUMF1/EgtB/PvdO family nonheme iron enzyme, partial [Caldilineaceae bacterium]|nr:SUMF1/EgtB/PvdO family nonheme iron enzyme [Caldilineaceae bacterium]
MSTPKRRWWRVAVALVALIGVIYFSAIGIDNYQTTQRHNAQATALVKAHPTATAMAEEAAIVMVAAIPEAQRLVDDYGIRFVEVPAGEFRMGSTQAEIDDAFELCQQDYNSCSRDRFTDEAEQHTVSVDTFWIMQTEVTNAQFAAFVEAGGYAEEQWWTEAGWAWRTEKNSTAPYSWDTNWNQPDHPVVGISWYEAMAYAKWLTDQIDLPIRLPTEAEWEKAARGTEGLIFPWGNTWDGSRVNYCDSNCEFENWKDKANNDGYVTTAPVGRYPGGASPYGALDMAGNVWEWTS